MVIVILVIMIEKNRKFVLCFKKCLFFIILMRVDISNIDDCIGELNFKKMLI